MKPLDSIEALQEHQQIIQSRSFLRQIYTDTYNLFKGVKIPEGKVIELGSGGGFIKKIIPKVITSDVVSGPGIDQVFSATKIPFKNNTVAAYLMIDVFHHIKDVETALNEMQRTLKKGGKIIMVEPYNSIWGRFIYKNFHHENFDPDSEWKIKGKGRMSDANIALPWIVFKRDRQIFANKFPNLKIVSFNAHTPVAYLISGGLSKKQLLPGSFYRLVKKLENIFSPISPLTGMFVTIVIEKC